MQSVETVAAGCMQAHSLSSPTNLFKPRAQRLRPQVTALVRSDDEIEEALALGASSGMASSRAFDELKGTFDVILNCATARLEWAKVFTRGEQAAAAGLNAFGAGCVLVCRGSVVTEV